MIATKVSVVLDQLNYPTAPTAQGFRPVDRQIARTDLFLCPAFPSRGGWCAELVGGPHTKAWQSTLGPLRTSAGMVSVRAHPSTGQPDLSDLRIRNEVAGAVNRPESARLGAAASSQPVGPLAGALKSEAKRAPSCRTSSSRRAVCGAADRRKTSSGAVRSVIDTGSTRSFRRRYRHRGGGSRRRPLLRPDRVAAVSMRPCNRPTWHRRRCSRSVGSQ